VHVEYSGLIARLTGANSDQFSMQAGDNVENLLKKVLSRHEALAKGKSALFIAVNRKALPAHLSAWRQQLLYDGDRVMITVRIIGG
jgi:hypothetical protein